MATVAKSDPRSWIEQKEIDRVFNMLNKVQAKLANRDLARAVSDVAGVTLSFYSCITMLKMEDCLLKPVPAKKSQQAKLEALLKLNQIELRLEMFNSARTFGVAVTIVLNHTYAQRKLKRFELQLMNKRHSARFAILQRMVQDFVCKNEAVEGLLDALLHKIQDVIDETDIKIDETDINNDDDLQFANKLHLIQSVSSASISSDFMQRLESESRDRQPASSVIGGDESNTVVWHKSITLTELTQMGLLLEMDFAMFRAKTSFSYQDEHGRQHQLTLANAVQSFHLFEFNKIKFFMQRVDYEACETLCDSVPHTTHRYRLTAFDYCISPLIKFFGHKWQVLRAQIAHLEQELEQILTLMKKKTSLSRIIHFEVEEDKHVELINFVSISFLKESYPHADSDVGISLANVQKMLLHLPMADKMHIVAKLTKQVMHTIYFIHSKNIFFGNMLATQFFFDLNGEVKMYDVFVDSLAHNLVILILNKYVSTNLDGTKDIVDSNVCQLLHPDSPLIKNFFLADVHNVGMLIASLGMGLELRTLAYSEIDLQSNVFQELVANHFSQVNNYPQEFRNIVLSCIGKNVECRPSLKMLIKNEFFVKFCNKNVEVREEECQDELAPNVPYQFNVYENRFLHDFKCIDTLGKGSFGRVYKVQNKLDERMYAIKVINNFDPSSVLMREVRNISCLSHDNIVRYYCSWVEKVSSNYDSLFDDDPYGTTDLDEEDSQTDGTEDEEESSDSCQLKAKKKNELRLFIQMELCESTLRTFIVEGYFNDNIPQRYRVLREICCGLVYLHAEGMIHRDLKPDNIFFLKGRVKIGDFGLSCALGERRANYKTLEDLAANPSPLALNAKGKQKLKTELCDLQTKCVGTFCYIAPEMRSSSRNRYDAKVDVYSLGVIYLEMLYPMSTGMQRIVVFRDLSEKNIYPQDLREFACSKEVKLLRCMLSRDPAQRPELKKVMEAFESIEKGLILDSKNNKAGIKDDHDDKWVDDILSKPTSMKFVQLLHKLFKRSAGVADVIVYNFDAGQHNLSTLLRSNTIMNDSRQNFMIISHIYGGCDFALPLLSLQNEIYEPGQECNAVRLINDEGNVVKLAYANNILQRLARSVAFKSKLAFFVRASIDKTYRQASERRHPQEVCFATFSFVWPKEMNTHALLLYTDIIAINLEFINTFMPRINHKDRKNLTPTDADLIEHFEQTFPLEMFFTNLEIFYNICRLLSISDHGYFALVALMTTHMETITELISCHPCESWKLENKRKSLLDAIKAEMFLLSPTKEPFFLKENTIVQIDQIILKLFLLNHDKLDDVTTSLYQILSQCFKGYELERFMTSQVLPSIQRLHVIHQLVGGVQSLARDRVKFRFVLALLPREAQQCNGLVITTMTSDFDRPRPFSTFVLSVCGRFDHVLNLQGYIIGKSRPQDVEDNDGLEDGALSSDAFYAQKYGLNILFNLDKLGMFALYWLNTMLALSASLHKLKLDVVSENVYLERLATSQADARFRSTEVLVVCNSPCAEVVALLGQIRSYGLRVLAMPEMDNLARDIEIVYRHSILQGVGSIVAIDASREKNNLVFHLLLLPALTKVPGRYRELELPIRVDPQRRDVAQTLQSIVQQSIVQQSIVQQSMSQANTSLQTFNDSLLLVAALLQIFQCSGNKMADPTSENVESPKESSKDCGKDAGGDQRRGSVSCYCSPAAMNVDVTLVKTHNIVNHRALVQNITFFVQRKYRHFSISGQVFRVYGLEVSDDVIRSLQKLIIDFDSSLSPKAAFEKLADALLSKASQIETSHRAHSALINNFTATFLKHLESALKESSDLLVLVLVGYGCSSGFYSEMIIKWLA